MHNVGKSERLVCMYQGAYLPGIFAVVSNCHEKVINLQNQSSPKLQYPSGKRDSLIRWLALPSNRILLQIYGTHASRSKMGECILDLLNMFAMKSLLQWILSVVFEPVTFSFVFIFLFFCLVVRSHCQYTILPHKKMCKIFNQILWLNLMHLLVGVPVPCKSILAWQN